MEKHKFCDLCGKPIEHDRDLEICEDCLKHGMKTLKKVLGKIGSSKRNK